MKYPISKFVKTLHLEGFPSFSNRNNRNAIIWQHCKYKSSQLPSKIVRTYPPPRRSAYPWTRGRSWERSRTCAWEGRRSIDKGRRYRSPRTKGTRSFAAAHQSLVYSNRWDTTTSRTSIHLLLPQNQSISSEVNHKTAPFSWNAFCKEIFITSRCLFKKINTSVTPSLHSLVIVQMREREVQWLLVVWRQHRLWNEWWIR